MVSDNKKLIIVVGVILVGIIDILIANNGGDIAAANCDICGTWKSTDRPGFVMTLNSDKKTIWRFSDGSNVVYYDGAWKSQGDKWIITTLEIDGKKDELKFEIREYELYGPLMSTKHTWGELQGLWKRIG
ncbi:MAG: hypothetical protein ABH919_04310 [bacterium]